MDEKNSVLVETTYGNFVVKTFCNDKDLLNKLDYEVCRNTGNVYLITDCNALFLSNFCDVADISVGKLGEHYGMDVDLIILALYRNAYTSKKIMEQITTTLMCRLTACGKLVVYQLK